MVAQTRSTNLAITMAVNANMNTSYELSNYEQLLASVIEKAKAEMNKEKGGAKALKSKILEAVQGNRFFLEYQVQKPDEGRKFELRELCNSYVHETTQQLIDPRAVEKILFGPDGLIRKAGGGRAPYLMEDIEVGYIKDAVAGTTVGPIITSGRNRTLALQIMLHAAGVAPEGIAMVKVRTSVIEVQNATEIQRRIISANTGSRDFSRAEIRERMGSASGVDLIDRASISSTIKFAKDVKAFKAALGAYIKDAAFAQSMNTLTPAQYSDAGNGLWNMLAKANKPDGKTFYSWAKADTSRFVQIAQAAEQALPGAVNNAIAQTTAGPLATKLAKALAPVVANRCGLNVNA